MVLGRGLGAGGWGWGRGWERKHRTNPVSIERRAALLSQMKLSNKGKLSLQTDKKANCNCSGSSGQEVRTLRSAKIERIRETRVRGCKTSLHFRINSGIALFTSFIKQMLDNQY